MPTSTVGLDANTFTLLLVLALGGLGMKRGIRTEGITLAGVLGSAVIFASDGMREALIRTVNKLPQIIELLMNPNMTRVASAGQISWFKTPAERMVFFVILFALSVILFYYIGAKYGSRPMARLERFVGGIMGIVSGFAIGYTVLGLGDYLASRAIVDSSLAVSSASQASALSAGNSLAEYVPLLFLLSFTVFAILAATTFRKAKL